MTFLTKCQELGDTIKRAAINSLPQTNKEFMDNFTQLGLSERSVTLLTKLGFVTPTEVQSKAIGPLLEGHDIIATAQTGTGKTAAYALPIIEGLGSQSSGRREIRALILVPTRELALQVKSQVDALSKYQRLKSAAFYGGTGYGAQIGAVRQGIDIAIATPGRLNDLLQRQIMDLSQVQYFVLDEADRMLDMGFMPQVKRVMTMIPEKRQTMMFTATLDHRMQKVASDIMNKPTVIRCKQEELEPASIEQQAHKVGKGEKDDLLLSVLQEWEDATVLVFTRTRRTATQLTRKLKEANVEAEEIHSDISQHKREKTIARYRAGSFNVLVATDIAARGLDVPAITHVVNYDLPTCAADYIHRIGRTGRAGKTGVAHSFISNDQRHLVKDIEKLLGRKFVTVPRAPGIGTGGGVGTRSKHAMEVARSCFAGDGIKIGDCLLKV